MWWAEPYMGPRLTQVKETGGASVWAPPVGLVDKDWAEPRKTDKSVENKWARSKGLAHRLTAQFSGPLTEPSGLLWWIGSVVRVGLTRAEVTWNVFLWIPERSGRSKKDDGYS